MQTEPQAVVSVFASYAPPDQTLQQELNEHLRSLLQAGLIELGPDHDRNTETAWEQESGVRMILTWLFRSLDTGGEVKKWGKIPQKRSFFSSWWGYQLPLVLEKNRTSLRKSTSPPISASLMQKVGDSKYVPLFLFSTFHL